MILTKEQIKALIWGAVHYDEQDGYLKPRRFTPKQVTYYESYPNGDFPRKARSTSSIAFCCRTDATEIAFDYSIQKASSRNLSFVDFFVDGVMVDHQGNGEPGDSFGTFRFSLPEGTHNVKIAFSGLSAIGIKGISLENATVAEPLQPSYRVLTFGDSITQGYDAAYPSQSYANLLAASLNAEMVNQAIGGEVFNPGLIDADIPFDPDIVTVAYGTNDFSKRKHDDFVSDATEFYARVRKTFPRAKLFAILPIWRADEDTRVTDVGTLEYARGVIRGIAAKLENTVVIEGLPLVPHIPEFYSDLRLHPNDMGFKFYGEALANEVKKHL